MFSEAPKEVICVWVRAQKDFFFFFSLGKMIIVKKKALIKHSANQVNYVVPMHNSNEARFS